MVGFRLTVVRVQHHVAEFDGDLGCGQNRIPLAWVISTMFSSVMMRNPSFTCAIRTTPRLMTHRPAEPAPGRKASTQSCTEPFRPTS